MIIDVQLLEVDRTRLLEYGLQVASPGSPGINGSVTVATDANQTLTLQMLKNLSASDILLTNLPGLYYRLLKSDSNTRILANPQLRASEGATASARFGDRVPVPVTTFTPIATGGTPQQPIVSFNYENIGVNIDITPRTHHDDDVTLLLNVAVTNISGTGFGGLPTFGNREIKTQIRLRDGETNLLAGLIRDDERRAVDGIPGLSDLPGVGRMFGHTTKTAQQTDIVLTLTPHIVRAAGPDRIRSAAVQGLARFDAVRRRRDLPVLPAVLPPPPSQTPARAGSGHATRNRDAAAASSDSALAHRFLQSAPILTSSAAVNSFSAKATGHIVPWSSFALSLKPNVAYLALNLCAL